VSGRKKETGRERERDRERERETGRGRERECEISADIQMESLTIDMMHRYDTIRYDVLRELTMKSSKLEGENWNDRFRVC
jgi:hypothetical protein